MRDRVLTLLNSKTASELTSYSGKEALRTELLRTLDELLEDVRVLDVYFSEFLVQ